MHLDQVEPQHIRLSAELVRLEGAHGSAIDADRREGVDGLTRAKLLARGLRAVNLRAQ